MANLFHPLCGSNISNLLRLYTQNGGVSPSRLPHAAIALAVTLMRLPFSIVERLVFDAARARRPPIQAPIFIIGYWRSGTTHLHNVLSQAKEFGYISPLAAGMPWDLLGIVRALEPLLEKALPDDRYVDKVAVKPDSPQEDSIALASMVPVSYYHGIYFPRRFEQHFRRGVYLESCNNREIKQWQRGLSYFLEKVSIHQHGKRLLIKNPVYTGHIRRLREIWPDAKFIHIYRNPYVVFQSTRHFFTRLLPELALQSYNALPIDDLILESYPRMMNALLTDAHELPAGSFAEVRFEDLEQNPLDELKKVYHALGLPAFDTACLQFTHYLDSIRNYRKNRYVFDEQAIELVNTNWLTYVQHYGYVPPQSSDLN